MQNQSLKKFLFSVSLSKKMHLVDKDGESNNRDQKGPDGGHFLEKSIYICTLCALLIDLIGRE